MIKPCKGASREQMLNIFRNRVFYCLQYKGNSNVPEKVVPCVLSRNIKWDTDYPCVVLFDNDMRLLSYSKRLSWDELFDSWEEATKRAKHIEKLYTKGFYETPFVKLETLEKYKGEMVRIEKLINKGLENYPNFVGIDFCDVGANGIQIRGHHNEISRYTYGAQPTIKYDFTNKNEVITEFIDMWKESDTQNKVNEFKNFIAYGEKYGWD